jgi:hypothetical protein
MVNSKKVKTEQIVVTLNERLLKVQSQLVGEKGSHNNFGKYKYRNVEDILTEIKPLLLENDITMTMSDSIKEVGGEIYIEARVVLECAKNIDVDSHDGYPRNIVSQAYAREPKTQGGMSPSQMTGTASSYARKYALGALFLISGEACPDYATDMDRENKELSDSLDTLQDKDKGKGKDKDKDIIVPKLGKVVDDVKKDRGSQTPIPIENCEMEIGDLSDDQMKFFVDNVDRYFKGTPIFKEALINMSTKRKAA